MIWQRRGERGLVTGGAIALALFSIGSLATASRVEARSRDFSAPPAPPDAPSPRARSLRLSIDFGARTLLARWRDGNTGDTHHTWQLGPELRLGVGWAMNERTAIFLDARGAVSFLGPPENGDVVRFGGGIAIGGVGTGIDWFLGEGSCWRWSFSIRRAWARPWGFLFIPPAGPMFGAPVPVLDVWLAEVGTGYVHRSGRVDRGWVFAAFGGPSWSGGQTGWLAGLGATYAWSR
jgi:hypothetical protein